MVATVGSISIDLSTNSVKFAQGFKGAAATVERESARMARAVSGVERSMLSIGSGLKSFGTGLLAGAGLTSLTGMIGKAREAISRLDDIADRAKTSGLGTDLFQSMEIGARQAGIEIDTLNSGLQTFAKGVGLAEQGTGKLFSGLEKLNPELLNTILHAENQEERLKAVADAMDRTTDATAKAALSQMAFGDVDFSRLLEGGSKAIDTTLELAKAQGSINSPELIKQASEYDAELNRLAASIDKNLTGSFTRLGPVIIATMSLADRLVQGVAKGIEGTGPAVDRLGQSFRLLGDQFTGGQVADLQAQLAGVEDQMRKVETIIAEKKEFGLDAMAAERALVRLRDIAVDLRAQITTTMTIDLDTSQAKARIADLAQAFRASENASMAALAATTRLPTVTRLDTLTTEQRLDQIQNPAPVTGPVLHHVDVRDTLGIPKHRAIGGPMMAGQSYWVGENGAELLVLS